MKKIFLVLLVGLITVSLSGQNIFKRGIQVGSYKVGSNIVTIDSLTNDSGLKFYNGATVVNPVVSELPYDVIITGIEENYFPDTILVWHNGRIYYATSDKLSDYIYPVEAPFSKGDIYVSPSGDDSNSGTFASPYSTWQKAFSEAVAGDTIYIRGGVYYPAGTLSGGNYYGVRVSNVDGTAADTIKVLAYPDEVPILDGTNLTQDGMHFGISLDNGCDYWYFRGLTVRNFTEHNNGDGTYDYAGSWSLQGNYVTYNRCVAYGCGNGFYVGGSSDYVYYTNCDAYHNFDHYDAGGYANGFSANINAAMHIFYTTCRAWENSDDGYDFFGSDGYITCDQCWAFWNGTYGGESGNGAGIKLGDIGGPKEVGVQRTIVNCLSFENDFAGLDESMDAGNSIIEMNIYNNTCYNNGRNFNFGNRTIHTGTINFTNNISYQYTLYADNFRTDTDLVYTTNSWQGGLTVTNADFTSVSSTGADGARSSSGVLPVLTFMHLAAGSDLINAGTDVGYGNEIGCYQY